MKYRKGFITGIFCAHVIAGTIASGVDWFHPFSASKEVARFIEEEQMNDMLIVGHYDFPASALSAYLNRKIYYLQGNRFGSFVVTDKQRVHVDFEEANKLIAERKEDVLVILNCGAGRPPWPMVTIKEFLKSTVVDEMYTLYVVKYDDINSGP